MAVSKSNAEEYTQTLAQHMVASYRQIELAYNMGVPAALGFDNLKDWVNDRLGGYMRLSMQQRREAVKELEAQYGTTEIAEILGIHPTTARRDRREQLLVDENPDQDKRSTERANARVDDLESEIDGLTKKLKDERRKVKEHKAQIEEYQEELYNAEVNARAEAEAKLTDQERARAKKEADAWANEQGAQIIASMAHVFVVAVADSLREAGEALSKLVERGGITPDHLAEIEQAHATFVEEFNIARMSEMS